MVARKATFLLALIWMASPAAGLRPMRAVRLRTWRMPDDADTLALFQVLGVHGHQVGQDGFGLLLGQLLLLGDGRGEVLEGDGG